MRKFIPRALCAAALAVGLAGGPVGAETQAGPHSVATVNGLPKITIQAYSYMVPKHVPAGARVKVVNLDDVTHTVTADDRSFNVRVHHHGHTGYFTAPAQPGRYTFFCRVHSSMHGVLVVK